MNYHIEFDLDFKRNIYLGKFIVFEGIDGSGKTVETHLLAKELKKQGKKVFLTKNPTDSPLGKFIRKMLQGKISIPLVSFQYIFSADRQIQQLDIVEHLKKGDTVISDRYFWSSVAYGVADKEGVDYENSAKQEAIAQSILSMYNQFIVPDITFYLDASIKTGLSRRHDTDKEKELYENTEKLKKIERGYKWLLQEFPKEFTIINAERTKKEVHKEIMKLL
ncbi:MAG: dTMP kinase [Patescibacteria group bacterium]|nr:dTMP kinase [Patescibacteria group bacterium]